MPHKKFSPSPLAVLIGFFAFLCASLAAGQTETVIHRFTRSATDGGSPTGSLIEDKSGNLYGTTAAGGAYNQGTVYQLARPAAGQHSWKQTILYSFMGLTDGAGPSGLVFDAAGNLYGTTYFGGDPTYNNGVVFELSPPAVAGESWTEAVLYTFDSGGVGGANPVGNLVFDPAGNLYGVTQNGGAASLSCGEAGCGTVFQLTPPPAGEAAWTETDIYSFLAVGTTDGFGPTGVLVRPGGALYGTTSYGGTGAAVGTFFKLTPPTAGSATWTEKVLYNFPGGSGGGIPSALEPGKGGVFYGTTGLGGASSKGTVFELTTSSPGKWTGLVLYSFSGGIDGSAPEAGVTLDPAGNLYGTTFRDGTFPCNGKGCGTVFKLSPPAAGGGTWTKTTLHDFAGGRDGFAPGSGSLLLNRGVLFGTTVQAALLDRMDMARCSG